MSKHLNANHLVALQAPETYKGSPHQRRWTFAISPFYQRLLVLVHFAVEYNQTLDVPRPPNFS